MLRLERDEGVSYVSGRESHIEDTASTNALKWEDIWHVGGIEKKPE